jgi:CHAT domain-containing protein
MGSELEAVRERAERLQDASDFAGAAMAWGRLSFSLPPGPGGEGDLRALAALSRGARAQLEIPMCSRGPDGLASKAAHGLKAALGESSAEALYAEETVASCLMETGSARDAVKPLAELTERSSGSLGAAHPQTLSAKRALAKAVRRAGDPRGAAAAMREALDISDRELGADDPGSVDAAAELALDLYGAGDYAGAAALDRRVLAARELCQGPDDPETVRAANYLALDLNRLGEYAEARALSERVLADRARILGPSHPDTLLAANNLAVTLRALGDFGAARDVYATALKAGEGSLGAGHPDMIMMRANLATLMTSAGDPEGARRELEAVYEESASVLGRDHEGTLAAATSLADALWETGERLRSRELYESVLASRERVLGPEHPETLLSLVNVGNVQYGAGEFAAARRTLLKALEAYTRLYGPYHPGSAAAEVNLGLVSHMEGDSRQAVFFLKLAVEASQRTRATLAGDAGLARSYLAVVSERYHLLFSELMKEGRAGEAIAVLELLKEDELRELVPETEPDPASAPAVFAGTPDEAARSAYMAAAERDASLEAERKALSAAGSAEGLDAAGAARLKEVSEAVPEAKAAFLELCASLPGRLDGPGPNEGGPAPATAEGGHAGGASERVRASQARLAGSGAVLVYAVSAPESLYLLMVTPDSLVARESAVGRERLEELAMEFRRLVHDPQSDPRPVAKRLYDALLGPLARDIEASGAETLVLSLDGALRYAPVAALWDGERWLAEKHPTVLFTASTLARMGDGGRAPGRSAMALGVSEAQPGYAALPGVAREIGAIVGSGGEPGVMQGDAFLNDAFDREALARSLASDAPVVHVASHFNLDPSSLENTVLLLGGGGSISLREMRSDAAFDFSGLDLLTLSACDTGSGARRGDNGKEVESLGELLQRSGASAVLATLLPVDDSSAPDLMREFYRLRYVEGADKAEALRGAQLAVMRGAPGRDGGSGADGTRGAVRGVAVSASPAAGGEGSGEVARAPRWDGKGFSHPYYWAPFVVMGDWR